MATPYCGAIVKQWESDVIFFFKVILKSCISHSTFPPVSANVQPCLGYKTHAKTVPANDRQEDPCQTNLSSELFYRMYRFCS